MSMVTGRVIEVHRTNYMVALESGVVTATVRGFFHDDGEFPKVGDYVTLELIDDRQAVIETILPRISVIKRQLADSEEEQILVANVDLILIVMGLDNDFNLSRLERYLALAKQSGVPALVLLNKADVVDEVTSFLDQAQTVAGETEVLVVTAKTGDGLAAVASHLTTTPTAVLRGSSGAGKSTITNWLLNEERQAVQETRGDDNRGRHTTTSRQLFALPQGGFLIDTPGLRELGVAGSETEAEESVFERVEYFAEQCQFRNCDHEKSAGCAVLAAVAAGELTQRELKNYLKLLSERTLASRKAVTAATRHRTQNELRAAKIQSVLRRQKR